MGYTYDIATSQKDKKSTIGLSVCHIVHKIIEVFVSTFLIAHIYSLTTNLYSYAINVAIYQMSAYACMFVVYLLCSYIVDKTNRVWIFRLSNIIEASLVIVTIFFGKDLAKIVILAGVLKGLSHGTYYASYNVLKQEMVSRKSMDNYAVILMVLTKVVNVVCPILLGALIDISTFSMVAIYVLIISIIQITISFMIKSKRPNGSDFNLRDYLKRLKNNSQINKNIKFIYLICVFYGSTTIVSSLLNINIMIQFGSNFSLGAITSVFALVSIIVILLAKKFTKFGKRSWMFIAAGIAQIVGAVVFVCVPNMATLIIYNFSVAICEMLVATFFDVIRNKNLKEAGLYQDIAEHQCIVESIFQIVRVVTFALLIGVALLKNYILFQIIFVFFVVLHSITSILLARYEKVKNEKDN